MKDTYNKRTVLQSFKLLVTAKRKRGVIVEKPELVILWDDYVLTLIKQSLVNPNHAKKWRNPYE